MTFFFSKRQDNMGDRNNDLSTVMWKPIKRERKVCAGFLERVPCTAPILTLQAEQAKAVGSRTNT